MVHSQETELSAAPVAEYMKIRQYVIGLAAKSSGKPAKIPSMPELGRKFGVARTTVYKALKDLVRDNYLVVSPGIGSFINPAKAASVNNSKPFKCIGFLVGDGKHCFYDKFYWSQIALAGQEAVSKGFYVKMLSLSSLQTNEIVDEVKDSWADGLLWFNPSRRVDAGVKALHAEKFPLAVMQRVIPGVNSVSMDFEKLGYDMGLALLKEGRKNTVFAVLRDAPAIHMQLAGLKRAYSESGLEYNEHLILENPIKAREDLQKIIGLGVNVEAVYIDGPFLSDVMEALRNANIDIKSQCRLVAGDDATEIAPEFCGLAHGYRFAEEAQWALAALERMLNSNDFCAEERLFDFKIETVNMQEERYGHQKT